MFEIIYNKLLLIDGSHALHRNIAQPNLWDMRNSEGYRTGGVFGTLNTILKETSKYNNYFPVVIFDGHLSPRRLAIYDNYKRNRDKQLLLEGVMIEEPTEVDLLLNEQRQEYNRQREVLIEILMCLGIPVLHLENWEGDDLIYILSKMTKDSIIVSDDKDMLQMIYDSPDRRCSVRRGMRDEFWDLDSLKHMGINQAEYIACKAICGDVSDNIPSACYQVGEKTALGLYKIYMHCKNTCINFPKDEKELSEVCNKLDVAKRKAYLNFDENQFLINMLLMDLSFVENDVTPELIYLITNDISTSMKYHNYELAVQLLDIQDIRNLNLEVILNNVNKSIIYASMENYDAVRDSISVPIKKCGGLF